MMSRLGVTTSFNCVPSKNLLTEFFIGRTDFNERNFEQNFWMDEQQQNLRLKKKTEISSFPSPGPTYENVCKSTELICESRKFIETVVLNLGLYGAQFSKFSAKCYTWIVFIVNLLLYSDNMSELMNPEEVQAKCHKKT